VTSLAAGLSLVKVLRIELNRAECLCLGYVLGSATVSMTTLGLGFLSLVRKEVFLALSVAALLLLWRLFPWIRTRTPANLRSIPFFSQIIFLIASLVWGFMYFRYALLPETSPDGVSYHLGFVNLWNHAHGVFRIEDMYAAMPQGAEMLYLFAFSIGRHSSASLVHFSMLMLLPFLMVLYGVRFGFPKTVGFAAILVLLTPVVGWDGSIAYNDVALAVVALATIYTLQLWRVHRQLAYLLAAGFLAGFAFSVKYTGCFVSVLVLGTVAWELRREEAARVVRVVLIASAAIMLAPLPYLLRNWLWFQNPVSPFGNSIFHNPYFHVSLEKNFVHENAHLSGIEWKEIPGELTIGGPKLPESLGPIYVLAPFALIGLIWPPSRCLIIAALIFGFSYLGNKSARFLIPVLPPLALASAYALGRMSPRAATSLAGLVTLCQMFLCWPAVTAVTHAPRRPGFRFSTVRWTAALRQVPEEQFLDQQLREYEMARYLDTHLPAAQAVFAPYGGVAQAYTNHFVVDSYHSAMSENFTDILDAYSNFARLGARKWTALFPATHVQQLRVVQNGSGDPPWVISDLQFWQGSNLLAPSERWRADSDPNPWDIRDALDGTSATRWSSWVRMAPGMHVNVWPDGAPLVDQIVVQSHDSQWFSRMDVEIQGDRKWVHPVSAEWQTIPPTDLRKAAMQSIKKRGISYLVITREADREGTFGSDPSAWGIHQIVSLKNATLYFID
jgi:Dolichyl-phosphate-mannose-protein mannosyltransferase